MATLAHPARAITPFDVSDNALFVDDTWRAPFQRPWPSSPRPRCCCRF